MKFGQLIEYEMRNIFLKEKCGGEASPRPFYKKSKLSISLDQTFWNVMKFVFIVCPSHGLPKCIKTKVLTTCSDLV